MRGAKFRGRHKETHSTDDTTLILTACFLPLPTREGTAAFVSWRMQGDFMELGLPVCDTQGKQGKGRIQDWLGISLSYLVTHLQVALISLLQRLLQKMKTTSLEGKFRRAFSSEDNRECCHQRYLLSHVDQGNN